MSSNIGWPEILLMIIGLIIVLGFITALVWIITFSIRRAGKPKSNIPDTKGKSGMISMVECPKCHQQVDKNVNYCPACGSPISQMLDSLKKLSDLKDQGLITPQEFEEKKQMLLKHD